MSNARKFVLGTLGVGAAGVLGLGLLSNTQNGNATPTPTFVPLQTVQTRHPTPDPNSTEYKQVLTKACEAIINNGDMDCGDFATHDDAQQTYELLYKCYGTDVFRLDRDSDGSACETLP